MRGIPKLFRPGMSGQDLYEATRGVWKLGRRRKGARFAFAVESGIVREVYEIQAWHPAGSTAYASRKPEDTSFEGDGSSPAKLLQLISEISMSANQLRITSSAERKRPSFTSTSNAFPEECHARRALFAFRFSFYLALVHEWPFHAHLAWAGRAGRIYRGCGRIRASLS